MTLSKQLLRIALAASLACLAAPAMAQVPPQPPGTSVIYGYKSLAVSNSSSRVALPAVNPPGAAVTVFNSGAVDAFVKLGTSSVAATNTDVKVKAGTALVLWVGATANTNLAAITASSTTTLDIWQANGPVNFQPTAAASSAATTVNQGTSPWVVSLSTPSSPNFQISACASGCNVTWAVQNAAYSAGNSLGGLITLTGAARSNGGTGIVLAQRLKSTSGATPTVWVYAWSKTPTSTCTDKSAFVSSASDGPYAIPGFPYQTTLGGSPGSFDVSTYSNTSGINGSFKNQDSSPGTAIYLCVVLTGSLTPPTTSDYSMVNGGLQD